MRLIDADAYSAEMKDRQDAAWKWRNEAIAEEDEVKLARAEGAFTAFTEAKLTMDKHIISLWHRVEYDPPNEKDDAIFYYEWTGISGTVYRETSIVSFCELIALGCRPIAWMEMPEPPKEDA